MEDQLKSSKLKGSPAPVAFMVPTVAFAHPGGGGRGGDGDRGGAWGWGIGAYPHRAGTVLDEIHCAKAPAPASENLVQRALFHAILCWLTVLCAYQGD